MTRKALLAAALALAACSPDAPQDCPGRAVGRFVFDGTLLTTTTTLAPGLDPLPGLADCQSALGFPATLVPFEGTLASDESTSAGALCPASGAVMFGRRDGDRWSVAASSGGGAVLPACGPTCAATSRVVVTGDVIPDALAPTGFRGGLVEQLEPSEGSCDACVLPCAARYDLSGTVVTR